MKKILTLALAALFVTGLFAVALHAADNAPAGKTEMAAGPLAKLNLTDDQKAKIKEILQAAREQAQKAEDPKAKLEAFKAALETIKTTVLTDEQRKEIGDAKGKLGERLGKLRERLGQGKAATGEGAGKFSGPAADKFNLTDDQKAKIKEILQAAHQQAQQATDLKGKLQALKSAIETIRTTVLTDDQRKQLEDMKGKFQNRRGEEGAKQTPPATVS